MSEFAKPTQSHRVSRENANGTPCNYSVGIADRLEMQKPVKQGRSGSPWARTGTAGWCAVAVLALASGCDSSRDQGPMLAKNDSGATQSTTVEAGSSTPSSDKTKRIPNPNLPVDENGFVTFGVAPETTESSLPPAKSLTGDTANPDVTNLISSESASGTTKSSESPVGEVSLGRPETTQEPADAKPSTASEEPVSLSVPVPSEITLGNPVSLAPTTIEEKKNFGEPTPAKAQEDQPESKRVEVQLASDKSIVAADSSSSSQTTQQLPNEANVATEQEKNQKIADGWAKPQVLLFVTGQQQGYLEPCGCTGLANQKGGLNRRDTLLTQLKDRGWEVVPLDVGSLERRRGVQAVIKLQTSIQAMKEMGYRAATLGLDDLKLSSGDLIRLTAPESSSSNPKDLAFVSANSYMLLEEFMPKWHIVEAGGRKIGVTSILGESFREKLKDYTDVITSKPAAALPAVQAELKKAGCDYFVLLAHATLEESAQIAKDVPGFNLVVTAGGFGEPTYMPEPIEGTGSVMVQVGTKGMYAGLVGIYDDAKQPIRYQRVALSSQFEDSPRMLKLFEGYQKQLKDLGFEKLGLSPATHPSGREFVGSQACGECHTRAYEKWKQTPHFHATDSLVKPGERATISRHFDPECLSCHVTGWNPQKYFPFATGFESLERTPMLTGSGCENCHGPGSQHVKGENGDIKVDAKQLKIFQEQMRLPLAEAREKCLECHDLDNSPEFQLDGAFEKYWQKIAHPWRD